MRSALVFFTLLLFGAWLLLVVPSTTATRLIIDDVEVVGAADGPEGCSLVRVRFNFPVRYKRHFPYSAGEDLRIRLESIVSSTEEEAALLTRETVVPTDGDSASLTEVTFEGNIDGGPYLSLIFSRPVMFDVKQGADFRSIDIAVSAEGLPNCLGNEE